MKTLFPYTLAFLVFLSLLMPQSMEAQAQSPADTKQPKKVTSQKPPAQKKPVFVAPPRTISDITAFLDQEKPDPAKLGARQAAAAAEPPAGAGRAALKDFYWARARARASLGRLAEAVADSEKAVANADDYVNDGSRIDQLRETELRQSGDYKGALAVLEAMARKLDISNTNRGRTFVINLGRVRNLLFLAEIERAEKIVKQSQALLAEARSWDTARYYLSNWEALVEEARARVLSARGRYSEAEAAYLRAGTLYRDAQIKCPAWPTRAPCEYDGLIFYMTTFAAAQKGTQGRLVEAEIDVRQALFSRLKAVGKYNPDVANGLATFSQILHQQARFADAERIARASIEIFQALGYDEDARPYVFARQQLAAALFNLQRYDEVKELYLAMDHATRSWAPDRSAFFRLSWTRIFAHYFTNEVEKGIGIAREAVVRHATNLGEQHYNTAMTRAILATGLMFAGRDEEALREFSTAVPRLLAVSAEQDDDPTSTTQAERRLQFNLGAFITVLARSSLPNRAEESLQVADAIRSRAVQNALAAAAARAAARTPALADLARKEQDLDKQIQAQAVLVNNVLAEPPEERQGAQLKELRQELERLRVERRKARQEITRRFPEYSDLVRPQPATADSIRAALRDDEALVSFYFGGRWSFVWAMTKTGPLLLAALPVTAKQLEEKVKALRLALDSGASSVSAIPEFDVAAAHEFYRLLLDPVQEAWRPAKTLIVVTNGALGQLPISLLPTQYVTAKQEGETRFAWYRRIPWLARTHAVVTLPSASALRILRTAAAPPAKRQSFIGFGDPIFSAEQVAEPAAAEPKLGLAEGTRGGRIKLRASVRLDPARNADLGMLPRLPDTADELIAVAAALQADPAKVLHLGRAANEKAVATLDLASYRIVAFATHGLVPGDLDGLTQPALALTAPSVADIDGDGLLTTDEILQLKLNADWVVLSACNTAAGQGEGAEAISGLGRAFLYAGSRALLVTNWPVHSESARDLVSDVFRRQASSPGLTRAEALRQAMMSVLDSGAAKDESGKTLYSYGHPLFWAPYSLVGDGGS